MLTDRDKDLHNYIHRVYTFPSLTMSYDFFIMDIGTGKVEYRATEDPEILIMIDTSTRDVKITITLRDDYKQTQIKST
jgi:hypothetical protein